MRQGEEEGDDHALAPGDEIADDEEDPGEGCEKQHGADVGHRFPSRFLSRKAWAAVKYCPGRPFLPYADYERRPKHRLKRQRQTPPRSCRRRRSPSSRQNPGQRKSAAPRAPSRRATAIGSRTAAARISEPLAREAGEGRGPRRSRGKGEGLERPPHPGPLPHSGGEGASLRPWFAIPGSSGCRSDPAPPRDRPGSRCRPGWNGRSRRSCAGCGA